MRGMKRRTLLQAPLALTPLAAWADLPKVDNLADALRWLDRVAAAKGARTTGAWPLSAVLEHLAQSIEMSLDGYPSRAVRCSRTPWARQPSPSSSGAAA